MSWRNRTHRRRHSGKPSPTSPWPVLPHAARRAEAVAPFAQGIIAVRCLWIETQVPPARCPYFAALWAATGALVKVRIGPGKPDPTDSLNVAAPERRG